MPLLTRLFLCESALEFLVVVMLFPLVRLKDCEEVVGLFKNWNWPSRSTKVDLRRDMVVFAW